MLVLQCRRGCPIDMHSRYKLSKGRADISKVRADLPEICVTISEVCADHPEVRADHRGGCVLLSEARAASSEVRAEQVRSTSSNSVDDGVFEEGDQFVLSIDPSFLELDLLFFDGLTNRDFASLFREKKVTFHLPGKTGEHQLELSVDQEDRTLSRKGLGKKIPGTGKRIVLQVRTTEPLSYQLLPGASSGKTGDLDSQNSKSFAVQPGWEHILETLACGSYSKPDVFSFHEQACALTLCQPLDRLISLASLPEFVPYPHQVNAVKAVISKFRGRALLCDEVGLGKTIEACLVMLEYLQRGLIKNALILAPPSLTGQWQEELRRKFGLDFVINDEPRFQGWDQHKFILASLSKAKLSPHREALCRREFDLVIVDEAHHLRNRSTKSWQLVSELKKRHILFLTATPMQNGLSDIYSLVTLLKPGHLKTYKEFQRQFVSRTSEFVPRNLDQLRGLLQGVMVRNKRSHTNVILSKRHARTIELEPETAESEYYERITALVRRAAFRTTDCGKPIVDAFSLQHLQLEAGSSIPATLPTLRKLAERDLPSSYREEILSVLERGKILAQSYASISSKAKALVDLLKSYGDKMIVFTRFHETLVFLSRYLQERGISTALFHGGMRRAEKDAEIQRFMDGAQVLISSESGGEGRNLQFCRALLNYDLPWNPMKIEQRIGRIHRLGQERDVHIFNLSARGTAESYVLQLLDKKINLFELVVGEVDMILGNLDEDKDFEEVIFNIWSQSQSDGEVASRLEVLGRKLAQAKAEYLSSQEFDDKVFGDALLTV
jgi:superfamily II DNA or RNA helicase